MERLNEYHEEVKRRISAVCPDRMDNGDCNPPEGRLCALELNLPDIIKAVKAVHSERIQDYADSIRQLVCEQCINRDEHGDCYYQDQMQCCLDNFMIVVVDAIEEVDRRHAA